MKKNKKKSKEIKTEEHEQIEEGKDVEIPDRLPILPVRDIVVFPYMILPLFVGRDVSIKAIDKALSSNRLILLVTQKEMDTENPTTNDLHRIGTVGVIMRMLKLPDGRVKILVQGLSKARILKIDESGDHFKAEIEKLDDKKPEEMTIEIEALIRNVKEQLDKAVSLGKTVLPDVMVVIENLDEPGRLADLITSNLGLKTEQAQEILEIEHPVDRLKRVSDLLNHEIELLIVQQRIQSEARPEEHTSELQSH